MATGKYARRGLDGGLGSRTLCVVLLDNIVRMEAKVRGIVPQEPCNICRSRQQIEVTMLQCFEKRALYACCLRHFRQSHVLLLTGAMEKVSDLAHQYPQEVGSL